MQSDNSIDEIFYQCKILFDRRMHESFPGYRNLNLISNKTQIIHCLSRLLKNLKEQITPNTEDYFIWWTRGIANNPINSFEINSPSHGNFTIDNHEIDIEFLYVNESSVRKNNFVYVHTSSLKPTGLYSNDYSEKLFDMFGYNSEEYARSNGKNITRQQGEDRGGWIDGNYYEFDEIQFRTRHLSPYNFFIVPRGSAIFDIDEVWLDRIMTSMLNDRGNIEVYLRKILDEIKSSIDRYSR